ncbi:MAG: hypothetical protein J5644_03830 [Bacteroidales bacterium]|nr:hypothetical protein [Bacteroidales bacterium]
MSISKNYSQAQAIKEHTEVKLRAMQRVLAGEPFTISTDRVPRTYHFVLRDDLHKLMCGDTLLGSCDTGAFFPSGFVVMTHLLGDSANHSVLTETIRFVADTKTNGKGGARC